MSECEKENSDIKIVQDNCERPTSKANKTTETIKKLFLMKRTQKRKTTHPELKEKFRC